MNALLQFHLKTVTVSKVIRNKSTGKLFSCVCVRSRDYTLTDHFISYSLLGAVWTPYSRQSFLNSLQHRFMNKVLETLQILVPIDVVVPHSCCISVSSIILLEGLVHCGMHIVSKNIQGGSAVK